MLGSLPQRFIAILSSAAIATTAGLSAQTLPPEELSTLQFRHIGVVGNRIASVAGVVGNPLVYYAGQPREVSGKLRMAESTGVRYSMTKTATRSEHWQFQPLIPRSYGQAQGSLISAQTSQWEMASTSRQMEESAGSTWALMRLAA